MPVSFPSVGIVELVSAWIGSCDTLATHDVACTCALVKVAVGLFRVERQSARLGAGYLCWLEHVGVVVLMLNGSESNSVCV